MEKEEAAGNPGRDPGTGSAKGEASPESPGSGQESGQEAQVGVWQLCSHERVLTAHS